MKRFPLYQLSYSYKLVLHIGFEPTTVIRRLLTRQVPSTTRAMQHKNSSLSRNRTEARAVLLAGNEGFDPSSHGSEPCVLATRRVPNSFEYDGWNRTTFWHLMPTCSSQPGLPVFAIKLRRNWRSRRDSNSRSPA